MKTFESLDAARAAEEARGHPFVEIRRITDAEWDAYETPAEVPPEVQTS